MQLVRPSAEHLPSYVAALERGWSHDSERGAAAAAEELLRIRSDASAFLAALDDRAAQGPPVTLPDGSRVAIAALLTGSTAKPEAREAVLASVARSVLSAVQQR